MFEGVNEDEDDTQGKFEKSLRRVAWVHCGKRLQTVHHTEKDFGEST